MEALTSFGSNNLAGKTKSDFIFSEHGLGLKLSCLRLASNSLIISKTKPIYDCGTAISFISVGLLSTEFIKKADAVNGFLVAPLIAFEMKGKRFSKNLTP